MTIKQIQHLLAYLGYYVGSVDGQWGQLSRTACKAFQKDFGLEADGISGTDTQKALKHSVAYGIDKSVDEESTDTEVAGTFWADIPNFTRDEFKCKCGGQYCDGFPAEPQEAMVQLAHAARTHFGRPATVVSGLRCPQWNAIQGGVDNSQHMYGEACDIYVQGIPGATVLEWFLKQPGVRYAYQISGSQNVHYDIPKGDR